MQEPVFGGLDPSKLVGLSQTGATKNCRIVLIQTYNKGLLWLNIQSYQNRHKIIFSQRFICWHRNSVLFYFLTAIFLLGPRQNLGEGMVCLIEAVLWRCPSTPHYVPLLSPLPLPTLNGYGLSRRNTLLGWCWYFPHRVVGATGYITDHHIGDGHNLAILWFFNENSDAARDDLAVKFNTLGTSNEFPITVVTCRQRKIYCKFW